jgi:RimJ/RimL family protein N-acetyltransferase
MRLGSSSMANPLLVDVPVRIETQRLVLRPHRSGDGRALHEALVESITELRKFLWFLPWVAEEQTPDSAEVRCRTCEANFTARTDLPFLAFDRSSGRLVGSVGLHRTDWQVPKTEVGYWIRPSATGNGYAVEGVRALVDWAFDGLGAHRVELVTDEQNLSSRKVADRCGFELEGIHRNVQRAPDGSLRNSCIYARLPPVSREQRR